VEAERAATARDVGIVRVEREQERVREQFHVDAVGGEVAGLISFTTSLSKKKLNSGESISTNVLPSAAVPVKYERA
jgi:hypothetical protein